MFGFLLSEEKKMRRHAANWLEVAERVHHFRRDQLTAAQTQKLQATTADLKMRLKERVDASNLKLAIEKLEGALREVGGRHYPVSSLVENVEFFLVAAIVILGLRAYFVQPFKIPTNSMWPTYYGMTHELYRDGESPGLFGRVGRLLALGATHYEAKAPADGEVLVPAVQVGRNYYRVLGSERSGRTLGVFPTMRKEYTFSVAGSLAKVDVPADFDFDSVLEEKFAGSKGGLSEFLQRRVREAGPTLESSAMTITYGGRTQEVRVYWVPVGQSVHRGEPIVSFDIRTGDLLFVDRISYNFVRPKVGQGFVFRTDNIVSPSMETPTGEQIRQYYIKRLSGAPGDVLEIKPPALWRNGQPITGAAAYDKNAHREGIYPGYTNTGLLAAGQTVTVPEHDYFALGDNSPRSADSRYWGFVPEKDVVGRPLFIYYPLTSRWGLAR